MAVPERPVPVKLIVGVMYAEERFFDSAVEEITSGHGPIDHTSSDIADEHYQFYGDEMGTGLVKCILSFERLVDPATLPDVKIHAHTIEQALSIEGRRRVNLDPGILSAGNVVLASAKPRPRRIYLRDGIYAELELVYQSGHFHTFPWTYPDHLRPDVQNFLEEVRATYLSQLKDLPGE